jgi:predicted acyl esterase
MMQNAAVDPATLEWWSYARPAEYDVVGTTIDVPVRDGITIACALRRPARDGVAVAGPFPGVVVEFTPYVVLRDFYCGEADFFASRGYNAVVATLRGVGGSGGNWDHGSFRQAGRDAHDLIEWLAAKPFCDGRVGMFGESFGGQTSYSAAVERPEHLVAIAPMQSPSSLYHDVVFPGGSKTTERGEIDNWPDIANLTSGGVIDAGAGSRRTAPIPRSTRASERPVVRRLPGRGRDPGPRDRRMERQLLPVRHAREHRSAPRAYVGDLRALGPLLPGRTGRGRDVGVHGRTRARACGNATVAVRRLAGVVRSLAHRPRRPPDSE